MLEMYYGASAGSERKALQRLQEPNVMISYATMLNEPWEGIENLFIDSGGYSLMIQEGEHPPIDEYAAYISDAEPAYWAYQDYPCEPDILKKYGRTVDDHIGKTVERAVTLDQLNLPGTAVPVIQGWEVSDYLQCIGRMRDRGVLPAKRVGIGSVCGRDSPHEVAEIISRVGSEIDGELHGFGVKTTALTYPSVRNALTSADSLAYSFRARIEHETGRWEAKALEYLRMKLAIEEQTTVDQAQTRLPV